jgi:hypothetical protein
MMDNQLKKKYTTSQLFEAFVKGYISIPPINKKSKKDVCRFKIYRAFDVGNNRGKWL